MFWYKIQQIGIENIFVDSNCISYNLILEEKAVLLCKTSAQYNHNSMNE